MLHFARTICILIAACCPLLAVEVETTGNHVTVDTVRFTIVSPSLIRLEESSSREFIDQPSLIALHRDFAKSHFIVKKKNNVVRIETEKLLITYNSDYNGLNPISLKIEFRRGNQTVVWSYSTKNTANLGGAVHDINGISGGISLPDGLLSRDGYYLLDDSKTPILVNGWPQPRKSVTALDLYFFGYGLDYKQALGDFNKLTGGLPLLPKWALGVWLLSDWPLSSAELTKLVSQVQANQIPVDTLVVHDWNKWGWTSFDWDNQLFPKPQLFLNNMHQQGIRVGFNTHPGGALQTQESRYRQVTEIVGWDPTRRGMIFFDVSHKKQAQAILDALLKPIEEQGVDFWWVDGAAASTMQQLDSQWWTNSIIFKGTRENRRPLILGNYGGLGSQKFPVQYVGTPEFNWNVLKFLTHYIPTAGNVGVVFTATPLGGKVTPMFGGMEKSKEPISDELLTRWLQLIAFSPITMLQTEQGKIPWLKNKQMCQAATRYFRLRAALVPYLYTLAKIAQEDGVPICRPMYLEYPDQEEAYNFPHQYMVGKAILVAPVVQPEPTPGLKALKEVWFPPGEWHEFATNRIYKGPMALQYPADLDTIPIFIKSGSIIPMYERRPQSKDNTLVLNVHSGNPGQFVMYMDDGVSREYMKGAQAVNIISYAETNRSLVVRISENLGKYSGMPTQRPYVIRLVSLLPPDYIEVNGELLPHVPCGTNGIGWSYTYETAQIEACIGVHPTDRPLEVVAIGDFSPEGRQILAEMRELGPRLESSAQLLLREGGPQALVQELRQIAANAAKVARDVTKGFGIKQARILLRGLRDAVREVATRANLEIKNQELKVAFFKEMIGISVKSWIVPAVFRRIIVQSQIEFLPYGWGKTQGSVCIYQKPTEPFPVLQPGEIASFEETLGVNAIKLQEIVIPVKAYINWNGVKITLEHNVLLDNAYLKQFYVLGPFGDGSFRKMSEVEYPWEKKVELSAEYPGKRGRVLTWQKYLWEAPVEDFKGEDYRFVDLGMLLERVPPSIGYATSYVFVPQPVTGVFEVGSAGGITLWVNEVEIFRDALMRQQKPNQVNVSVQLQKGWNSVRIKSIDEAAMWGFYLRLVGIDGKPIPGAISGWGKGF